MEDQESHPCVYVGSVLYEQVVQRLRTDCTFYRSFFEKKKIDFYVNLIDRKLEVSTSHVDGKKSSKVWL